MDTSALITLIISIVTFVGITCSILFFPHIYIKKIRIDTYWMIALLGALVLLIANLAPINIVAEEINNDNSINPLKILVLFFSMTCMSIFLDETGLFRYLANKSTKLAKNNQYLLLILLYLLTSVLTVFTSNDIVILTLTPFICFFCKNTKVNPLPYLVAEFAAANTWSMMLIIGNPTNIYLATSAGINFIDYIKVMALPTVGAGIIEFLIITLIFHKPLKEPIEVEEDEYHIESKVDLIIGASHLLVCLVFLIISSYINMGMWLIALICASSLLVCIIIWRLITRRHWDYLYDSVRRLPYQLIPFVISMFVIVVALNYQGISAEIARLLNSTNTVWGYGLSSFLAANVINNIPMSILFSSFPAGLQGTDYLRAIYATIIGSNIGAFLTPLGALAGIMFSNLTYKYGIKYGFRRFTKYGVLISIPTLAVSLLLLMLVL